MKFMIIVLTSLIMFCLGSNYSAAQAPNPVSNEIEGMSFVKGGCFQMGDTFEDGDKIQKPVHEVCVSDFRMGKHDVTVGDFRKFMTDSDYRTEAERGDGCYGWTDRGWEKNTEYSWKSPGYPQTDQDPAVCVSWNDAAQYIRWKSGKEGKAYRLPTEAEWEYAAKSGGKTEGPPHPIGQKQPDVFGLYDMRGTMGQWIQDWYGENYYAESPRNNPSGPSGGEYRVIRGSFLILNASAARASHRDGLTPSGRHNHLGFRLAVSAR